MSLADKCAEIMEGAAYDWTTKVVQEKPSDYLNDCLHYLETNFNALQILPVLIVQHMNISICLALLLTVMYIGGAGMQCKPPGTQKLSSADGESSTCSQ